MELKCDCGKTFERPEEYQNLENIFFRLKMKYCDECMGKLNMKNNRKEKMTTENDYQFLKDHVIWAITHYGLVKTDGIIQHLKDVLVYIDTGSWPMEKFPQEEPVEKQEGE